jgi:hypothetical protein
LVFFAVHHDDAAAHLDEPSGHLESLRQSARALTVKRLDV